MSHEQNTDAIDAAWRCNPGKLAKLIAEGADPAVVDPDYGTLLHIVAGMGAADAVQVVLRCKGVKVNATNEHGNTALHLAAGRGAQDVVDLLIGAGADKSIRNAFGKSPVDIARSGITFGR